MEQSQGCDAVNHLVNANKMVSRNPRMDASAHDDGAIWETGCQLERELKAANEMFRKLNIHALDLTDRIRRLEEAGDKAVLNSYLPDRLAVWNKAKEGKL
jgi:regulator of PEP synthase PpsR (kinase-PPPase family)